MADTLLRAGSGGLGGARLCLVGPMPPPEGGMANQTRQLAEKLEKQGLTVEVVRTNAPYSPAWLGQIRGLRALARLLPYLWRLFRAFRRSDVIHLMANSGWAWHFFAAPALWMAALCRRPVIVNYRGGDAEPFLRGSSRLVGFSMNRSKRLVVPSGFLQGVFDRHGMRADIIPNIVDLDRFHPSLHARVRGRHLVITRNLEPIYGIETALQALALLHAEGYPEATLSIAGIGPSRDHLRQLADDLRVADSVEFLGRVDRDRIIELYHGADVALNPSLVDNMPNSVLEAMACGVPVVSTQVGGVPFIVEHERTALLVPAKDPRSMKSAIARLFDDVELSARLRSEGLSHVQNFGWPVVAPQWLNAYMALLPSGAGVRSYQ